MKLLLSLLFIMAYAHCDTAQPEIVAKASEPKITKQEAAIAGGLVGATTALIGAHDAPASFCWFLIWHGALKPNNEPAMYTYITTELAGILAVIVGTKILTKACSA